MYILERLNVVKIVATEYERDKLLARGFKEVIREKKQAKKQDEKKAAK